MTEPVWITGAGFETPLGNNWHDFSQNLLAGKSGVRLLDHLTDRDTPVRIGASLPPLEPDADFHTEQFGSLNRLDQLILTCCRRALHDSGYWSRRSSLRIGLVLGQGAEWLRVWDLDYQAGGERVLNPAGDRESLAERVRATLGVTGPVTTVAAACASANYALAVGKRWLQLGWVDVCLAGSGELLTPMTLAAFGNLRALSRRHDAPCAASRPFDQDRDGFVVGEGAAMFVLEPAASARRRGANVYGEFAGFGASSDASHMIIPSEDPGPAAKAMQGALADARLSAADIDYVNAHATSTPVGDRAESRALKLVFGERTRDVPVSSTKSMTGHLLSAAAAVEGLACLVSLREQTVPPTINLEHPDPECDLCHVPWSARPHRVDAALSNSFGFGGSNTTAIFRRAA